MPREKRSDNRLCKQLALHCSPPQQAAGLSQWMQVSVCLNVCRGLAVPWEDVLTQCGAGMGHRGLPGKWKLGCKGVGCGGEAGQGSERAARPCCARVRAALSNCSVGFWVRPAGLQESQPIPEGKGHTRLRKSISESGDGSIVSEWAAGEKIAGGSGGSESSDWWRLSKADFGWNKEI